MKSSNEIILLKFTKTSELIYKEIVFVGKLFSTLADSIKIALHIIKHGEIDVRVVRRNTRN